MHGHYVTIVRVDTSTGGLGVSRNADGILFVIVLAFRRMIWIILFPLLTQDLHVAITDDRRMHPHP